MADFPPAKGAPADPAAGGAAAAGDTAAADGPDPRLGDAVLDNAAWSSLTGPHRRFAERLGSAARYVADVAPFVGLADSRDPQVWTDVAALVGPGQTFAIAGSEIRPPEGWATSSLGGGVQLVDDGLATKADPDACRLGPPDVPDMLDLVARTKPGPFATRTVELGCYLGIRRGGRLVAMAGERMHPPGWTEISAVCTDLEFRGQGFGRRLVSAVGAVIRERGDRVFLHATAANPAVALYESIGFRLRMRTEFFLVTVPSGGAS